ncbi:CHAT domain-containing protein [Sorangium sp. So ce1128]
MGGCESTTAAAVGRRRARWWAVTGILVLAALLPVPRAGHAQDTTPSADALKEAERLNRDAMVLHGEGRIDAAIPLAERALAIREKALGRDHPAVATSLNDLAALYHAKGDYGRAEPLLVRALAIQEKALEKDHPDVAASLGNLAALYHAQGDYGRARPLYERALAIHEKTLGQEHPDVARTRTALAMLRLSRGDVPEAVRGLARALEIESQNAERLLSASGDLQQKLAYAATLRGSTDAAISLHVQRAPADEAAKRLAITTILRRKGLVLDVMARGLTALRRRLSPEDRRLLDKLSGVSAALSALTWRGPALRQPGQSLEERETQLAEYRASLARLDDERQMLEAELARRGRDTTAELSPVSLAQVQAAVPDGAALVEMFRYRPFNPRGTEAGTTSRGEPRYVAYVLRQGGAISWTDLGEAAPIERAAEQLLRELQRPTSDPRPAARALDALVMQPIRRLLGPTRQILLSPDGALDLVPFGAVVDEEGHYLVERYGLTYLTGGRELLRSREVTAPRQGGVVIAAPDYDASVASASPSQEGDAPTYSMDVPHLHFSPLPATLDEGRSVAGRFAGTRLLLGPAATETAVKSLHGPRLLHVVTHGFYVPGEDPPDASPPPFSLEARRSARAGWGGSFLPPENPLLRAGLALAGANRRGSGGGDDGILTALEASQLDLSGTKLVVLSAAETGVGEVLSGEGVHGLRWALAVAGSETQVTCLWNPDDASTRELMQGYYARLMAGGGRSESMRQAQLAILATPKWAHPHHWASFIVSGNGAALDGRPVEPSFGRVHPGARGCSCGVGTQPPAGTGGASAALLAAAAILVRRRRRGARRGSLGDRRGKHLHARRGRGGLDDRREQAAVSAASPGVSGMWW